MKSAYLITHKYICDGDWHILFDDSVVLFDNIEDAEAVKDFMNDNEDYYSVIDIQLFTSPTEWSEHKRRSYRGL